MYFEQSIIAIFIFLFAFLIDYHF